ncbi:MAG TPA: hypothetical protein GXZ66_11570, partial [Clostridiaceae bacterium]|nr:hypothetical protein [Clostridiaceae bacterium]
NNEKIATVTMSDPGTYEEEVVFEEDEFTYFKTAVINDAEGNEMLKVENARLNPESSQLAIGVRNKKVCIDNLFFSYEYEETPTPEPTPTPSPTEEVDDTEKPAQTSPTDSDESAGGSSLGIIIGIIAAAVVGVVVIVLVCVVVIVLVSRIKKKNN